jgi:hypothetical protein
MIAIKDGRGWCLATARRRNSVHCRHARTSLGRAGAFPHAERMSWLAISEGAVVTETQLPRCCCSPCALPRGQLKHGSSSLASPAIHHGSRAWPALHRLCFPSRNLVTSLRFLLSPAPQSTTFLWPSPATLAIEARTRQHLDFWVSSQLRLSSHTRSALVTASVQTQGSCVSSLKRNSHSQANTAFELPNTLDAVDS